MDFVHKPRDPDDSDLADLVVERAARFCHGRGPGTRGIERRNRFRSGASSRAESLRSKRAVGSPPWREGWRAAGLCQRPRKHGVRVSALRQQGFPESSSSKRRSTSTCVRATAKRGSFQPKRRNSGVDHGNKGRWCDFSSTRRKELPRGCECKAMRWISSMKNAASRRRGRGGGLAAALKGFLPSRRDTSENHRLESSKMQLKTVAKAAATMAWSLPEMPGGSPTEIPWEDRAERKRCMPASGFPLFRAKADDTRGPHDFGQDGRAHGPPAARARPFLVLQAPKNERSRKKV